LTRLNALRPEAQEWPDFPTRWAELLDDFRRLRDVIG
jgi:hypothetical protein